MELCNKVTIRLQDMTHDSFSFEIYTIILRAYESFSVDKKGVIDADVDVAGFYLFKDKDTQAPSIVKIDQDGLFDGILPDELFQMAQEIHEKAKNKLSPNKLFKRLLSESWNMGTQSDFDVDDDSDRDDMPFKISKKASDLLHKHLSNVVEAYRKIELLKKESWLKDKLIK